MDIADEGRPFGSGGFECSINGFEEADCESLVQEGPVEVERHCGRLWWSLMLKRRGYAMPVQLRYVVVVATWPEMLQRRAEMTADG